MLGVLYSFVWILLTDWNYINLIKKNCLDESIMFLLIELKCIVLFVNTYDVC